MASPLFSGVNLPKISDYNSRLVLDQIRRARTGISRVEIAEDTGLTIQTVSNQVTKLISLGLVREGELRYRTRGKPRTQLLVQSEGGFAVGVHIDPAQLSFVLVDLNLNLVKRSRLTMPTSFNDFLRVVGDEVPTLLKEVPPELVRGIGVAVPGPVNVKRGTVERPPHLPDWDGVRLRDRVAEVTGLDVFIQKDSIAALTGELWFRNRSVEGSTLFAYLGFGLGFAHAQMGDVYYGSSGNAGELGHLCISSDGPKCWCGRRGCLGEIVSPRTIVKTAVESHLLPSGTPDTPDNLANAMKDLADLARSGDTNAVGLLRSVGVELARGILVFSDFVDASTVVVGGHQVDTLWPYLEEAFAKEHERIGAAKGVHGVSLARADFGDWGAAAGAASIVLDSAFSPKPSMLISVGGGAFTENLSAG